MPSTLSQELVLFLRGRNQPSGQHHEPQGAGPALKLCSSFLSTSPYPPLTVRPPPLASSPGRLAERA